MRTDPTTVFDTLKTAAAAAVVWFGGESGRIIVAGGVGGFTRWLSSERRLIRDGIFAVIGGAVAARYLWPAAFHLIGVITGPLERSPENIVMAGFLTGALGMGFVKVLAAMIATRAKNGGEDG